MPEAPHKVFPHGKPEALAPNLWQVRGSLPIPLRRNMTIHRQPDGTLLLDSVVAMDEDGMRALEVLGRPRVMAIPHGHHRMDAAFYRRRYSELRVACPPQGLGRAEEVCPVDGTPEAVLEPLGAKVHRVEGMLSGEYGLEVDIPGGKALILCDILGGPTPGEKPKLLMRLLGPPRGEVGIARIVRFRMIKDRAAVRASLEKMADIPDLRIITVAHGPPIMSGCADVLRRAAASL
jgi:hypothetical protein